MTPVIVHSGEMGDNDHAWFADLLRQYLPQKYGVDTGFVVNKESDEGSANFFDTSDKPRTQDPFISPQIDILLLDVLHNAPFCAEKTFKVCPVEMVLGAVEVTRTLDAEQVASRLRKVEPGQVSCRGTSIFTNSSGGKMVAASYIYSRHYQQPYLGRNPKNPLELSHQPSTRLRFLLDKALYWFSQDGRQYHHVEKDRLYHFIAFVRSFVDRVPVGSVDLQAYLPGDLSIHAFETGNAADSAQDTGNLS